MANCNTCENQEKCLKLSPCIVEAYEQGRAYERQRFAEWLENKDYINECETEYNEDGEPYISVLGIPAFNVLREYENEMKGGENEA